MDIKGYYKTLGVEENATQDEIQKKFHKEAIKWHPDKWINGTEEEKKTAEEKFKQVNEAYSVLGDEEKRKEYDRGGSSSWGDDFNGWGFNPFSFFRGSMNGSGGRHVPVGEDAFVTVNITLKEAYLGTKKEVKYSVKTPCEHCHGTGSEDGKTHVCPHCNGTGEIRERKTVRENMFFEQISTCPYCNGTGKTASKPCKECHGTGLKEDFATITIDIPAGVFSGARTSIEGKGCTPVGGGINGNLIVTFNVENDSYFIRPDETNLIHYVDLTLFEALCGCEKEFKYPDGNTFKVKFHECTKDGESFMQKGRGFPDLIHGTHERGDYAIVVRYKYPSKLSQKQKDVLKEFK